MMPAFSKTDPLIRAYVESEPWKEPHDRVMFCANLEVILGCGVHLFRGLAKMEAALQARALEGTLALSDPVWAEHDQVYRSWVEVSEGFLKAGMELSSEGYQVEGLDEFRRAVEEARCQVELWDMEAELPSIEEMRPLARPENPRPARYGT